MHQLCFFSFFLQKSEQIYIVAGQRFFELSHSCGHCKDDYETTHRGSQVSNSCSQQQVLLRRNASCWLHEVPFSEIRSLLCLFIFPT